MKEQTKHKLYELKGILDARVVITQNDANRAEATLAEMSSQHCKGYCRAQADIYRRVTRKY